MQPQIVFRTTWAGGEHRTSIRKAVVGAYAVFHISRGQRTAISSLLCARLASSVARRRALILHPEDTPMTALSPEDAGAVRSSARLPAAWDDLLLFDDQLTDEERMVRDTARDYAQDKLLPRVRSAYLDERFDREIMTEMGELGLLGATIPEHMAAPGWAMSPTAWSRARWSASIAAIARR